MVPPIPAPVRRTAVEVMAVQLGGLGFLQSQVESAGWGQKMASSRPPAWAMALVIFSLMALRVSMSNSPRPTPDWFEATTTRQPDSLRRAMASSEPGIGFHSSGDLMN